MTQLLWMAWLILLWSQLNYVLTRINEDFLSRLISLIYRKCFVSKVLSCVTSPVSLSLLMSPLTSYKGSHWPGWTLSPWPVNTSPISAVYCVWHVTGHHVPGISWPHARMAPPGIPVPWQPSSLAPSRDNFLPIWYSNHPLRPHGNWPECWLDIMLASLFRLCPGSGSLLRSQSELASETSHLTPSRLNSPSGWGRAILNKSNGRRLCDDARARGKTR